MGREIQRQARKLEHSSGIEPETLDYETNALPTTPRVQKMERMTGYDPVTEVWRTSMFPSTLHSHGCLAPTRTEIKTFKVFLPTIDRQGIKKMDGGGRFELSP